MRELSIEGDRWLTHKLGPFETRGNGSGVKVKVWNFIMQMTGLEQHAPQCLTGYQMRPIDAISGKMLKFHFLHTISARD